MSRLIDADDLIIEILTHDLIGDDKEVDKIILDAPTVKAIPVEWILKWACEFIDPNSEGYKMAMELVHDWRKENEENI